MKADELLGRPDATSRAGVTLRKLAGVQESLLGLVPAERARYTSMGGVVLGTATIAALSMAVAMYSVFGALPKPLAIATIVFAALWGLFILNLDRWLMSTTINRDGPARIVRFLPRIGLALIFGVIIAEPLLLGVFHTAIEKQVRDVRSHEVDQLEGKLRSCNPESDLAARPPDCTGSDLLNVDDKPDTIRVQRDALKEQAAVLRSKVTRDLAAHKARTDAATRECVSGVGDRCKTLWREAAQYRTDNGMAGDTTRLQVLNARIEGLSGRLQQASAAYTTDIKTRIQGRARAERSTQRQIGLDERLRARHSLASTNGYVRASGWALRIFFVVVDSLPVLVKLLTGRTAYDRVLAGRLAREERAQQLAEGTAGYRDTLQAAVSRFQIDLDGAAERNQASVRAWQTHAGTDDELRRLTVASAEEILRQTRGLRPPSSSNHSRGEP